MEERRFVVLLGILAILIAYRDRLPKDFAFPLPYPIPHLQIFTIPLFDGFVTAFGLFAFFMLVYVSEDLYRPWVRDIFRRAAWMTLMAFWGTFIYISGGLLVSIFVPNWLIIPYLIVFWLGLSILWIGLYEYLSERKRLIRRAVHTILSGLLTVTRFWIPRVLDIQFLRRSRKRILVYLRKHLPRFRPLTTLKNVKWKYLAYALAYVVVVWLSQLLVANPQPFLVLWILLPIALAVSITVAVKLKSWIGRFATFLTWLAITLGSIASGQLSRSIIALAPFTPSNWLLVIGLGLLVVLIAMIFYLLDLFRGGAFLVGASNAERTG